MTRKVCDLPVKELSVSLSNANQARTPIDRIVLHTMVGTINSADIRFNNPTTQVSAHYGVGMDGSLVHWVDEDWVAFHAGNYIMNQRSIGIEHEDNGKYDDPRPDTLYSTSAKLVADICKFYSIPCDNIHILQHKNVSDTPTGCPDALDTDRIIREASEILNPVVVPPTIVLTDQTKLPIQDISGQDMELQAVRSEVYDGRKTKLQLQQDIKDLGDKITELTNEILPPGSTVLPDPTTVSFSTRLSSVIRYLFS